MRVVVKGDEIENHNSEESQDIDCRRFYMASYNFGTFFIAAVVILEIRAAVLLCQAHQRCEIFLSIFASGIYIKAASDISRFAIGKEAKTVSGSFDAVNLGGKLHCKILISRTLLVVNDLVACRARFEDVCALLVVA